MLLTMFCRLSKSRLVRNELKSLPLEVLICVEVLPCCWCIRLFVDSAEATVVVPELSTVLALAEEAASTFNFLATDE